MLTFLFSTVLPIAWKTTLISAGISLLSIILIIIFGVLTVASDSLLGSILGFIFIIMPCIVAKISGCIFSISFAISSVLFILKLIL